MLKVLMVSVLITATCACEADFDFDNLASSLGSLGKVYVETTCRGKPDCDCSAGSLASGGSGLGACCSKYQCKGGMCIDIFCVCLNLTFNIRYRLILRRGIQFLL